MALIAQEANIVTVQVDAATASEAAALNTTLVDNTVIRFEQIYPVLAVSRLDAPSTPEGPLNPSPLNDIILAVAVAALFWAISATVLGRFLR